MGFVFSLLEGFLETKAARTGDSAQNKQEIPGDFRTVPTGT
jgi:hypothetical protein